MTVSKPLPLTTDLNRPVGPYLLSNFIALQADWSINQAIGFIRRNPPEQRVVYFYVVNEAGQLMGVLPVRKLLIESPNKPLSTIMISDPVALPENSTLETAWQIFLERRFLALPVVDREARLVGVLDLSQFSHKDLVEVTGSDRSDEIFQLLGVHLSTLKNASIAANFTERFPWLWANLAGGIFCALLASRYEELLSLIIVIALFIPVVLTLAESVSIQSVTLTLQSIHAGMRWTGRGIAKALYRELLVASMLGAGCGAVVALTAGLWKDAWLVGLALFATIFLSMIFSCLTGLALPLFLNKARFNPKVAAGPLVLATADVMTLLIFFELSLRIAV